MARGRGVGASSDQWAGIALPLEVDWHMMGQQKEQQHPPPPQLPPPKKERRIKDNKKKGEKKERKKTKDTVSVIPNEYCDYYWLLFDNHNEHLSW